MISRVLVKEITQITTNFAIIFAKAHEQSDVGDVTVQGPPPNAAQPASMHGYCGVNLKCRSKLVCRTPADPHFSAAP